MSVSRKPDYVASRLTIKILEVGELDALAHSKNIGSGTEAVGKHPRITGIEMRDLGVAVGRVEVRDGVLDISPGSDERREYHKSEREQRHASYGATEPENFAVGNDDDGQVLEDGVNGNGQELDGPSARVDHADKEERDGKPTSGDIGVEVAVCNDTGRLATLDSRDTNNRLDELEMPFSHLQCANDIPEQPEARSSSCSRVQKAHICLSLSSISKIRSRTESRPFPNCWHPVPPPLAERQEHCGGEEHRIFHSCPCLS